MVESFEEFCNYAISHKSKLPEHVLELFIRLMEEGKQAPNKYEFMKNLEVRIQRVKETTKCKLCQKEIPKIDNTVDCEKHPICNECEGDSISKTLGVCMDCEIDSIIHGEPVDFDEISAPEKTIPLMIDI